MKYILYNKKSNNQNSMEVVEKYQKELGDVELVDILSFNNYQDFFIDKKEDDEVLLIGGDGTINYFVNDVKNYTLPCNVYYVAAGTGNDFQNDLKEKMVDGKILLNDYVKNLPTVYVNGLERCFVNGIGFGIDGYACEEAERQILKSPNKKINYTSISINGLLFHYKRPNARVLIDGKEYHFKKVYLASTMEGRYYGGGMNVAPSQDRTSKELTFEVWNGKSRLYALINFPNIFKGTHIKNEKLVHVFKVEKEVEVIFDKPTALQIDGELVKNVTSYKVII